MPDNDEMAERERKQGHPETHPDTLPGSSPQVVQEDNVVVVHTEDGGAEVISDDDGAINVNVFVDDTEFMVVGDLNEEPNGWRVEGVSIWVDRRTPVELEDFGGYVAKLMKQPEVHKLLTKLLETHYQPR